jgi:HEAT repeat protein
MKELSDRDPLTRDEAIEALGRAKYRPAVPLLLTIMRKDKTPYVRTAAIQALGKIGDPQSLEPLAWMTLKDRDDSMRACAAEALGGIEDARSFEPLRAALSDQVPGVRSNAAWSLATMRDPRALVPLATALSDSDTLVRSNAAWALARFEDVRAANLFVSAMKRGLLNPPDPAIVLTAPVIRAVRAAVGDPTKQLRVRQAGLTILRRSGDPRVLEFELAMLKDPSEQVRLAAADSMLFARDPSALKPLAAALSDPDEEVAASAKRALQRTMQSVGAAGDSKAVPFLTSALENADPDVRKGAAAALGEIADASAAAVLNRSAEAKDLTVVASAYAFFIREGNPEREQLLIQALETLGDADMARDFLNCGNARLSEAGRRWRTDYGLDTALLRPELVTVSWGKKRR